MEIFIEKQLASVGYSLILGLIFGASYDIIRMIHVLCGTMSYSRGSARMNSGKLPFLLFLLTDFAWVGAAGTVFSVFVYWVNYGDFRWYLAAGVLIGFSVYMCAPGRAVMYVFGAVAQLLRTILRYVVAVPVKFALRLLLRCGAVLYGGTLSRLVKLIAAAALSWRNNRYLKKTEKIITFNIKQ